MPESPNEKLYEGSAIDPPKSVSPIAPAYAELEVTSNFSFLRGASFPDELIYQAASIGYHAIAITDVNSLAGIVRAYAATKKIDGFRLIVGARLAFIDGTPDVLVWPSNRPAYARLCRLLTAGRRRAIKGQCLLTLDDFLTHSEGQFAAVCPGSLFLEQKRFEGPRLSDAAADLRTAEPITLQTSAPLARTLHRISDAMGDRLSIAATLLYGFDDQTRLDQLASLSDDTGVPLLATNHVHYHDRHRRPLQDVVTCIRHGCTLDQAGYRLFGNGERYLKEPDTMRQLFANYPAAVARTLKIVDQIDFDLGRDIRYEYPIEVIPKDKTVSVHLRELTYKGAADRYPNGIPEKVEALLEKELGLIYESKYEPFFLTVHDLVCFAQSRGILCQGRGSAANSAVCYCLGVTSVDPNICELVFARFISVNRKEPPDIDVDFEHERREEVIQYVYDKYGRDRAAMTAAVISYRGRSAIRDVGKVLGFSQDALDLLATKIDWWHKGTLDPKHLREAGVDPGDITILRLLDLTRQLLGFPRHLSQHVGGMVISRSPLHELVPVENAAMDDRTVIEWDKDDLDVLDLFKVDILALGMLTCISKALKLLNESQGSDVELHSIPAEDSLVYDMASDADTVGVFQIESRAQMSMLPRLQPREIYDLVIEVAIVRPGPIQGDMVHPYLKQRELRRELGEKYRVNFPHEELRGVLGKTLGVPLFQEQVMRLAMVAAEFSEVEADQLRRAMAAWKRNGGLGKFEGRFVNRMVDRGYERDFADRCFKQMSGFGEYGFPESHAASFAKLVYASCWLKRFHPAIFATALLNSQPMGFYAPAQIVRDAREHGVPFRAVDVNASCWDCTLEEAGDSREMGSHKSTWGHGGPAVRLGLRQVKGMRQAWADCVSGERAARGDFASIESFHHRTRLPAAAVRKLAEAHAFGSLPANRRRASWEALALRDGEIGLFDASCLTSDGNSTVQDRSQRNGVLGSGTPLAERASPGGDASSLDPQPDSFIALPEMPARQETFTDYQTIGLSLRRHPVSFARTELSRRKIIPAIALQDDTFYRHGRRVQIAGLVLVRQRPGTASGVVFMTTEDETGVVNLICWSSVYERYRQAARHATLLHAEGSVQREGKVVHVLVRRMFDLSNLMIGIEQPSRDFH